MQSERAADYCVLGFCRSNLVAGWLLAKTPLCLLIGCSAVFGSLLASGRLSADTMRIAVGVLLTAMGAATWNSLQEAEVDATMQRTAKRPLPRRLVSRRYAMVQGLVLTGAGLVLLASPARPLPPLLALAALALYNGVYTPLKQKSLLALVPGAVCGALPPLIGWTAAGGRLVSYPALLLASLLVLWQVPHFCLILLHHRADYERGAQPSFLQVLSESAVRRISCVWISALALVMLLFTALPVPLNPAICSLIAANALLFGAVSVWKLQSCSVSYRLLFFCLNLMLFNHMLLLSIGRMLPL